MKTPKFKTEKKPSFNTPPKSKAGLITRRVAHQALMNVLEKNIPLASALSETDGLQNLKPNDKAFTKQLFMTTLRRYYQLDQFIQSMLDKPLGAKGRPTTLWMMLGAAQILFMNVENHAAVNTIVELVSRSRDSSIRSKKNLVNAILRNFTREEEALKEKAFQHPAGAIAPWLKERWEDQYGMDKLECLAAISLKDPPLDLSFQSQKALESFKEKLVGKNLKPKTLRLTPKGPIEKLPGFKSGLWWVQDISATIPVYLFGDVKGKSVLDLCAAPGGKTLQLLSKGAKVTSVDKSETRLKKLRQNLQRMGREATIISEDVLTFKPDELYDAILLDAPCSATGTLRRHPDLMMLKDNDSIKSLLELQKNILHHAFQFLKPNGILIYCVCSLEHEEGRDQIKAFLKEHPNASRANISNDELGDLNDLNIIEGDVLIFPTSLAEEGGADGFFISRLTKHK